MYNILTKVAVDIPVNIVDIENIILSAFDNIDKIYSYIVYAKYSDGKLHHWKVEFMLSQHDNYNQLMIADVAKDIANLTELSVVSETQKILGYKQPKPEVLLKTYEPLMLKLVKEEHNRWNYLDCEDLLQMCRLVIMRLYRNGYYIHKRLVRRAFNNEVLMHIRKDKNKPIMVSVDSTLYEDDSDDELTLLDTLPDTQAILDEQDMLDEAAKLDIIKAKREIIVKKIGQRQYDQLVREYGNNMSTGWSRKLVFDLHKYLESMNITSKSFNNKYN